MQKKYAKRILWDELKRQLLKVEKPARYTGGEIGARIKDPDKVEVLFALAFPDVYEVGMSHLGSQILYHILNQRNDVACERVYSPWFDMEALLRKRKWPLFTIENRLPLNAFDIVGFSLQYELTYTNVLAMLDLGGIPLRSGLRKRTDPLVIAGGPCAMAAEPLTDFMDAFALGDGEELVLEIVDAYKMWRRSPGDRKDLLARLSQIEGVYVPSLYNADYKDDGTIQKIAPVDDAVPSLVKRRVIKSLEDAPYPEEPLVPLLEPIHDRAMVEIFRGCTRGCRFCQAGMLYRPVRERTPQEVERLARSILKRTGYDEVSLTSLSSADYTYIKEVVKDLLENNPCGARVSLPSLRVDSFSVGLAEMLGESEKAGLTLAPEAGSQRMRDVINKNVSEEDILEAVRHAFAAGFSHIKLYFMIGLPSETRDDVLAIADLARRIRQIGRDEGRRPTVVVSCSNFVPKPHTPFQWEPFMDLDELRVRQGLLKDALRGKGLEFRYHDVSLSFLEAVFARGDRRLGKVLEAAFKEGQRFDAWSQAPKGIWEKAFIQADVDPHFYAERRRGKDEVLPWDHLSSGVRKEYLWAESQRAALGQKQADCRFDKCTGCGVCPDLNVSIRLSKDEEMERGN